MERLTLEGNFCDISQCRELPCKYDGNCSQKQVWDRLKAYEDSRLSPQACAEAREAEEQLANYEFSAKKMVEFIKADKDGRALILPCKVGDTVYTLEYVAGWDGAHCEIIPRKITEIGGNALNKLWLVSANSNYKMHIFPSEFGIMAFLTSEEAEKALQKMKGESET